MPPRCGYFDSREWEDRLVSVTRRRIEAFSADETIGLAKQEYEGLTEDEQRTLDEVAAAIDSVDLEAVLEDEQGRDLLLEITTETESLPTSCPHDPVDGERCVFHKPPEETDAERLREAFLEAVRAETDSRDRKQFVGAQFGTLDLSYRRIDGPDNFPIDCRYASFEGLTLESAVLGHPVTFDDCRFGPDRVRMADVTFLNEASFEAARFEAAASFPRARFEGRANFHHATFEDDAEFRTAQFGATAGFNKAEFHEQADFREATFDGRARFLQALFAAGATFWHADFDGDASFRRARLGAEADFEQAAVAGRVDFDRTQPVDGDVSVTLREATLPEGTFIEPEDGRVIYDFEDAEVGDLTLEADEELFEHFRFFSTTFDGFEFSQYRQALSPTWRLHSTPTEGEETPLGGLERTYLLAKNGASDVGDEKAASEFFLLENRYRRQLFARKVRTADAVTDRLAAGAKWFTNWFYDVSCGYGERPLRTVGVSAGVIVLLAGGFWLLDANVAPDHTALNYLTFSLQSFVTLILGDIPGDQPMIVRLLSAIEAFAGGFLIALFVFSLTRSLHR